MKHLMRGFYSGQNVNILPVWSISGSNHVIKVKWYLGKFIGYQVLGLICHAIIQQIFLDSKLCFVKDFNGLGKDLGDLAKCFLWL